MLAANWVVVSAASSSQSGKMPTTSVKPTATAIARPDENGIAHLRRHARRPSGGSAIQALTMIRRYRKAAITDASMAMMASA